MSSNLDVLLEQIAPSQIIDPVESRVNDSLNSFYADKAVIKDFYEFKALAIQFACHIENNVLQISMSHLAHGDMYWLHCTQIFDIEFGHGSEKTAFEISRTGNEGGFYKILKILAKGLAERYITQWIECRVHTYWNGLSVDEQLNAPLEYIEKYGHLLPSEMIEGSAGRIRADFTKVLIEHPFMIKRLRNAGRTG